jgi:HEAT repeat protein
VKRERRLESRRIAAALVVLLLPSMAGRAEEVEVDLARYQDPKIEIPEPPRAFSPRLKPLWLEALARPEVDLKRQAAQTIVLAHQRGMPDLADTAPPLVEALDAPDQHPVVMLAAARALVVLDARQAADVLFSHATRDGLEMAQLVEPALARWDYGPARKVWLDRLSAPDTPLRRLVLAIRGLAAVGETKAEPRLRELALAPDVPPDVRLEAAQACGTLRTEGLETESRRLAADPAPEKIVDRLVAAMLLASHRGEPAEALLAELALDPEPSVAAIALNRLLEIDPMLVIPVAEPTIANGDANVRRLGARALVAWRTPKGIQLLGPMLDDPHPELRAYVRRSLVELASEAELAEPVVEEASSMLAGERWRGLEQAAILLVALDQKPAVDRLVELLEFERPEVFIAAAWGLRRLAVPRTLDAMFDKFRRESEEAQQAGFMGIVVSRQLSQLVEAFGPMGYARAEPLLRKYIPKGPPFESECRAAAIWTLGHLHAGQPDAELVRLFAGRLSDVDSLEPEDPSVRLTSAVSLGRMKAETALPTLRKFLEMESINSEVGYACAWSIHEITGEPIPEFHLDKAWQGGWFLEPLDLE